MKIRCLFKRRRSLKALLKMTKSKRLSEVTSRKKMPSLHKRKKLRKTKLKKVSWINLKTFQKKNT